MLSSTSLQPKDQELIEIAQKVLKNHFLPDKHFVAAALRCKSGAIYTGFNIKTTLSKASVCAESIALANVLSSKEYNLQSIQTVAILTLPDPFTDSIDPILTTPCGSCRELLIDYAPDAYTLVLSEKTYMHIALQDLLPYKYKR